MNKYKVAILKNELALDHLPWVRACGESERIVAFDVIDLLSDNWMEEVLKEKYDLYILKPSGIAENLKRLYDERIYIIAEVLNLPVYPSLAETLVYENKRFLRDWLLAMKIPHPETHVFYDRKEAMDFAARCTSYPVVAKTNIGASGNGVRILQIRRDLEKYIGDAFSRGIFTRTGPRLTKGSLLQKVWKAVRLKGFMRERLSEYSRVLSNPQRGFVIFQEFIPHSYEWRCVRIGESYFAHKKLARNNMTSGSLLKDYGPVPPELLDFIHEITGKAGLSSVSIDLFETGGRFLVNEIQCIFGQSDPYQMLAGEKPGRYVLRCGKWIFEEGMFNTNQSYDLRLEHAISIMDGKNHDGTAGG